MKNLELQLLESQFVLLALRRHNHDLLHVSQTQQLSIMNVSHDYKECLRNFHWQLNILINLMSWMNFQHCIFNTQKILKSTHVYTF